jgi:hypothetical protein
MAIPCTQTSAKSLPKLTSKRGKAAVNVHPRRNSDRDADRLAAAVADLSKELARTR